MRSASALRTRLGSTAGFGLVEVMVAALLVVMLSFSVLGALDSASKTSGRSKAKAVAANLAQQDQERLRGLRPAEIMGKDETRVIKAESGAGLVNYTVTSKGEYFLAQTSTPGCTGGKRDEHLRITTTVDWPGRGATSPVTVESLIAPPLDALSPTQGNAVVRVTRFDNVTPVANLPITLIGPNGALPTVITGNEGCAYFGNIPVGEYTGSFGGPGWEGWADPGGNNVVTFTLSVTSDATASIELLYDTSEGEITVETWTHADPEGSTPADDVPVRPEMITFTHPSVVGGKVTFLPGAPPSQVVRATGLHDHGSPYGVYSGSCARNQLDLSPGGWSNDELDELEELQENYVRSVSADGSKTIKVFQPSFNVRVRYKGTGVGLPALRITFEQTDPGCGGTVRERRTATATSSSTSAQRAVAGTVPIGEGAMPYGTYRICLYSTDPPETTVVQCKTGQKNDRTTGRRVEFEFHDDDDDDDDDD